MDLDKIKTLMDSFEDSDIRELKLDEDDFHLYLSKNKNNRKNTIVQDKAQNVSEKEPENGVKTETVQEKLPVKATGKAIKAPIVGIVYLQAKPGQPAFVKKGDHVKKGDTIAIIEAMKMMTEIKSTLTGVVTTINVENEDLVEVDQPLITVEED